MNTPFTVVDLFAGCGGLSLGLEYAGFRPVFVNELNRDAIESYLVNREHAFSHLREWDFHCRDIKELGPERLTRLKVALKARHGVDTDRGGLDLLVGGPPCQGYSGIGHRRSYAVDKSQLPSNHLYRDMATVISGLEPKIFLFENVKGLLSSRWTAQGLPGEIWEDVLETFKSLEDYEVEFALVRAADYGVPQNRPRVLLVGMHKRFLRTLGGPLSGPVANGFLPEPRGTPPHPFELWGDLIEKHFVYGGRTEKYPKDPLTPIQIQLRTKRDGKVAQRGDSLLEQVYSKHSEKVIEKFRYMLDHDGEIPRRLRTKKFAQRVIPRRWAKGIGPTITATSLPDDYVHYLQARSLTVREWARLQGFPDCYQFAGPRTTGGLRRAGNPRAGVFERELPKYTQIGNAVPVWLAHAIGDHFATLLRKSNASRVQRQEEALEKVPA